MEHKRVNTSSIFYRNYIFIDLDLDYLDYTFCYTL